MTDHVNLCCNISKFSIFFFQINVIVTVLPKVKDHDMPVRHCHWCVIEIMSSVILQGIFAF